MEKISHKVLNKKRKISNLSVTSPKHYETQQNFQKKLDVASVQELKPEDELAKILEN